MSIDWEKFESEAKAAATRVEKNIDAVLSSRVSALTRLNDEEVAALFPKAADVEKLPSC
jgi:isopentenyldiphosphate isomerase